MINLTFGKVLNPINLFLVIIPLAIFFTFYIPSFAKYLLLIMSFYCLIISYFSKSSILTISSFFISSYFYFLIPYFFWGVDYATRQDFQSFDLSVITLRLNSIFSFIFLTMWFFSESGNLNVRERLARFNNPIIFLISIFIVITFSFLMVSTEGNAFTSDYRSVTEERYAFIDYSLVFILMAYVFSSEKSDRVVIFVGLFYCLICILYGYRLRFIQMTLLIFILFFESRFNSKVIFKFCVVAFLALLVVGVLRGLDKELSLKALFGGNYGKGVTVSNQGGVFLNATMYIGLAENEIIPLQTKITTFLGNFLAIFTSHTSLPENYNIVTFLSNRYSIPGGGLIVGYFYVWGGYVSVVTIALALGFCYRRAFSFNGGGTCYLIYIIVVIFMLPRWYAYNPLHLLKMPLIALLVYGLYMLFHQICVKGGGYKNV